MQWNNRTVSFKKMSHCSFLTIEFFLAPWCWPSHSHIRAGVSSIFNHSPPPFWKNKQKWKSSKWIFDPQVHLWRHGRPCHRDGIWRTPSCRGAAHPPFSHNPLKICPLVSVQHSLAQVIYFFALRNNVRAGIPVMRWWTMFEYCFRNDLNCF